MQVQYYDHILRELKYPQTYKIKRIIEHDCIKYKARDFYLCGPIEGYNSKTYNLIYKLGSWTCNCQGYNKRGICSHVRALMVLLKEAKQEELF